MSKVLVVPSQMAHRHLGSASTTGKPTATTNSTSSRTKSLKRTTAVSATKTTNPLTFMMSSSSPQKDKQRQQLSGISYNYNEDSICTTPIESIRHLSSSNSNNPSLLMDFDDFNSTSSIMEFLRQEQRCAAGDQATSNNGHDCDIDPESIFQEVSRLSDSSDTRSVDELLREAELLMQHPQYMGQVVEQPVRKCINKRAPTTYATPPAPNAATTSILMNSKYTKRIENFNPHFAYNNKNNKLNGNVSGDASTPSPPPPPPQSAPLMVMTPETPSKSEAISGLSGDGNTFNEFANNMATASVISEESVPGDFPGDDSTATMTQCSSNDENTTGKDVTTKQIDGEDTDDGTDTIEEITEAMETIELGIEQDDDQDEHDDAAANVVTANENILLVTTNNESLNYTNSTYSSISSIVSARTNTDHNNRGQHSVYVRRPSCDNFDNAPATAAMAVSQQQKQQTFSSPNLLASPLHRLTNSSTSTNTNIDRCNSGSYRGRRSSMTTPDSGVSSQTYLTGCSSNSSTAAAAVMLSQRSSSPSVKSIGIGTTRPLCCDKSVNSSPVHMVSTLSSPINEQPPPQLANSSSNHSIAVLSREHILKQEIEQLQERLKDTEERLESFRLQHDTVSQLHRKLRENNTHLQEESEMLKLDVQHLNECANVLRSELQAARNDRDEALDLQKVLQNELEETRAEKKRACEQKEKDAKHIQDLQRQCREMERILMRKHPDSVSALIVASKSSNISGKDQDNASSRKLLEQRIAQLEADAKEQDYKAQQILANVQARFNSVQSKYETHIADLETQVLSLQEINTKLNEKIESQVRTLDYFVSKKAEKFYNNCTQTEEPYVPNMPTPPVPPPPAVTATKTRKICRKAIGTQTTLYTRESGTNTIGTSSQHSASSSTSSTANSTPNNSRPNSKQSGIRKPMVSVTGNHLTSKLPVSQSDSTISLSAVQAALNAKEDAHLVATIRGMRVDLAIKNKALQRLTRELDECKKTIKKIQREKDAFKYNPGSNFSGTTRLNMDHMPTTTESQALKEAQSKCKLLEADYKSLHEKRLQDLKTLQTAHERELATCHETVRILQQRLNERDEQFAMQKRRKVPVDYYALKAKVSSLERRHTEREERLHMLVEALSKGRLNGALDDLLGNNNNQ